MNKRVLAIAATGLLAIGAGAYVTFGPQDSSATQDGVQVVTRHWGVAHNTHAAKAVAAVPIAPAIARADMVPAAFRILLTRSIFSSGGHVAGATTENSSGSGLSLCGILQQGAGFIAFIEDGSHDAPRQVKVGDPLAGGTVTGLDLHGMELACSGKKTRVQVGQSLSSGMLVGMPNLQGVADSPSDAGTRVATIR